MLFAESDGYSFVRRLRRTRRQPLSAYGISLAAFALATAARWVLEGYVPGSIPFVFYLPAVVIASLFGGFGPGLLAAVLSGLTAALVFMPANLMSGEKIAALLAYGIASLLLVGVVAALNWVLDRLLIEVERRRDADLAKSRLAAIVESSQDAMVTKDLDGIITSWNMGAERLFGYTAEEVIGKPVSILIPPEREDEEPRILSRIRCGDTVEHYETVRRCKDGSHIDISLTVSPVKDEKGKVVGASKVARDITERKRAGEQQELLSKEMSHRVKNAFAVFGSLVTLSARSTTLSDEMAQRLGASVDALARAHRLVRPGLLEAQTPAQPLTWRKLVHAILAPYGAAEGSTDRVIVNGTDLPIAANSVTALALVLHELATNAAKCGSLSAPTGSICIETKVADDQFLVSWEETGGPHLNGAPVKKGFGSLLAHRIITRQLGGHLSYDWRADGVIVKLSLPTRNVQEQAY